MSFPFKVLAEAVSLEGKADVSVGNYGVWKNAESHFLTFTNGSEVWKVSVVSGASLLVSRGIKLYLPIRFTCYDYIPVIQFRIAEDKSRNAKKVSLSNFSSVSVPSKRVIT